MNLFHPRTFSTDWEVMVADRLNRCVGSEKLMPFAGLLGAELELPVQIDWNTLEFAMGVNTSFAQLWTRIQKVTDRASQLVREYSCDLFPAGAHPVEPMFNANHIHIGTLQDESAGIHLENDMIRFAPAFAALAANSPVANGRRGEFKSYRVRHRAHGCTTPGQVRDPNLSQMLWGFDAGTKLAGAPTMEVRVMDCASSRRLLAEMAAFVAAFVHHRGTRVEARPLSPDEYRDALTNRWVAARDGMQATFCWQGKSKPVAQMLGEMLDECADELQTLGAYRADLALINAMIDKRVCQADFALSVATRYPDDWCFASAYAKLVRHWNVFDEYLESAAPLAPLAPLDEEAIVAEHLAVIGEGTHFYDSREAMYLPPPVADAMIERLIERGDIEREVTAQRGILLNRV